MLEVHDIESSEIWFHKVATKIENVVYWSVGLDFKGLTLKAPIKTAADDNFHDIFPNFPKK